MRTIVDIDDKLMIEALRASGLGTKRLSIEEGMRLLVRVYRQNEIRYLRGAMKWKGSPDDLGKGSAPDAARNTR